MKFPSIFRSASPMRFDIKPRYYDPVKEEIDQRTAMIKRQLQADGLLESEQEMDEDFRRNYGSSIRGAFTQGSPIRGKSSSVLNNAGLLRLIIIVLLLGTLLGYVYYGSLALYVLMYIAIGIGLMIVLLKLIKTSPR